RPRRREARSPPGAGRGRSRSRFRAGAWVLLGWSSVLWAVGVGAGCAARAAGTRSLSQLRAPAGHRRPRDGKRLPRRRVTAIDRSATDPTDRAVRGQHTERSQSVRPDGGGPPGELRDDERPLIVVWRRSHAQADGERPPLASCRRSRAQAVRYVPTRSPRGAAQRGDAMGKKTIWTVAAGTTAAVLAPGVAYALMAGGSDSPQQPPGIVGGEQRAVQPGEGPEHGAGADAGSL